MSKRGISDSDEHSIVRNKRVRFLIDLDEDDSPESSSTPMKREKTEKEKMLTGEFYDYLDEELSEERLECRQILKKFNDSRPEEFVKREGCCKVLFKKFGEKSYIEPPFHCDYGSNITIGNRCILNVYNIFLDCGEIIIGNDCLFGPGCKIIAVTHPLDYKVRTNFGREQAKPVKIGNDCFIGAGSIILPGVTIGDRVIVGAGSVVTTDIESDCVVGGNPAKVLKKIDEFLEKRNPDNTKDSDSHPPKNKENQEKKVKEKEKEEEEEEEEEIHIYNVKKELP